MSGSDDGLVDIAPEQKSPEPPEGGVVEFPGDNRSDLQPSGEVGHDTSEANVPASLEQDHPGPFEESIHTSPEENSSESSEQDDLKSEVADFKKAIEDGMVESLCTLHSQNANIANERFKHMLEEEAGDSHGVTPLMLAAFLGKHEIAVQLLEWGADYTVELSDDSEPNGGPTAFSLAVCNSHFEIADLILRRYEADGCSTSDALEVQNYMEDTPLLTAARMGKDDILKFLIDRGADIEATNCNGDTALHRASKCKYPEDSKSIEEPNQGYMAVMGRLLEEDPGLLDRRNHFGETPLMMAAMNNQLGAVKLLFKEKPDLEARDNWGYTSLHNAATSQGASIVSFLLDEGADPGLITSANFNALHLACQNGHVKTVEALLQHPKADLNRLMIPTEDLGQTPLMVAISNEHEDVIFLLLSSRFYQLSDLVQDEPHASSPEEKDRLLKWLRVEDSEKMTHETPYRELKPHHQAPLFYWGILNGNNDLVKFIMDLREPSQPPEPPKSHNVPSISWWHVASVSGNIDTFKTINCWDDEAQEFQSWEKRFLVKDAKGFTPLHLAAMRGNNNLMDMLLQHLSAQDDDTASNKVLDMIFGEEKGQASLMSLAIDKRIDSLEMYLWSIAYLVVQKHKVFEHGHNEQAHKIIELTTWRYTEGESQYFFKFVSLLETQKFRVPNHLSGLDTSGVFEWVVRHQFPTALWWLLSSAKTFDKAEIEGNQELIKKCRVINDLELGENNRFANAIDMLFKDPPRIRHPREDRRPPSFQYDTLENIESDFKVFIIDLIITDQKRVVFKPKDSNIFEIIYKRGPNDIMDETRRVDKGRFQDLQSLRNTLFPSEGTEAPAQKPTDGRRSEGRFRPEEKRTGPSQSQPFGAGKTGSSDEIKFRWIHIPSNSLQYVTELMVRISKEKNWDTMMHDRLASFVKKCQQQVPAGENAHYMRPNYQHDIITGTTAPENNIDATSLYMPYIFWASKSKIEERKKLRRRKDENGNKTIPNMTGAPQNTGERLLAAGEVNNGGNTFLPRNVPAERQQGETMTWKTFEWPREKKAEASEFLYESLTLDQYYYESLVDTKERDDSQVIKQFFKTGNKSPTKNAGTSKNNAEPLRDTSREEKVPKSPQKQTSSALQPQILIVNQLWLWIFDDIIITSTTEEIEKDQKRFLRSALDDLAKAELSDIPHAEKTLYAARQVASVIMDTARGFFDAQGIQTSDGMISPLDVYRKAIQKMREKEIKRFKEFRRSVDGKEGKNGKATNDQDNDNDAGQNGQEVDSENPYEKISDEVNQLESIKDVLDELNILKNLAQEQQLVDNLWNGIAKGDKQNPARPPSKILNDIQWMTEDAQSVQSDFNTLLDLKQKEAGIIEARATRRQSDTVMAFTVVTIIFLPASFLTSLFALDVSEFPHENGSLSYQGKWIFPIIFGVSTAVSGIFVLIAFNANLLKRELKVSRNEPPRIPESDQPGAQSSPGPAVNGFERERPYSIFDMFTNRGKGNTSRRLDEEYGGKDTSEGNHDYDRRPKQT